VLLRGCNYCGDKKHYPLPVLKKEIIYLDQFFFSLAFREQKKEFVDAAKKITDMVARQLIVCPYSSVHRDETKLWRHEQQKELYDFIKHTSAGQKFKEAEEVKLSQMTCAYIKFLHDSNEPFRFESKDAFRDNIHKWNGYFWVDVNFNIGDTDLKREKKTEAIGGLVKLFPKWRESELSTKEIIKEEANGYRDGLLDCFFKMMDSMAKNDVMAYLNAPVNTIFVERLLHLKSDKVDDEGKFESIKSFFNSNYFYNLPYNKISCELFAILRKMVKNGAYKSPQKAQNKLSGLFYDTEFISVFGPYCNAIFIDKAMMQWCKDPDVDVLKPYSTKLFSADNWNEFHLYLDGIEQKISDEQKEALKIVYPYCR